MATTLGDKISERRKARGWTQEFFSEKVGVHNRHVSRWETNKMRPSLTTLRKIADVLGMDVDDLLSDQPVAGASSTKLDPIVQKKMEDVQDMSTEDRAVVFRLIDLLTMERHMAELVTHKTGRRG